MRVFLCICFGQLISLIGTGLTGFALGVWVLQQTGSVTQFALIELCAILPLVVVSPLAGALVDRWDRRWTMVLSDSGAALSTLTLALLLPSDHLETWHLCLMALMAAIGSTCSAFQWPAYTAAATSLVPQEQLGRASGMMQLGRGVAQVIAPVLAGALLFTIDLRGIILVDFTTFLFALVTLLCVRFPKHQTNTADQKSSDRSLLRDVAEGWNYLRDRPGLLALMGFFAALNVLMGFVQVLAYPLVLSFTNEAGLGVIMTIGGIGILTGSVVMSIWGGPKRRMGTVFGFTLVSGLIVLLAGFFPYLWLFAGGTFVFFLSVTMTNCSNQVIFQQKVAPRMQGRIFAIHGALASASLPIAFAIAGPLADGVEALMAPQGALAPICGQIIGVGQGRGIALIWIVMGTLTMLLTVIAYQYPRLRRVEDELPDAIGSEARITDAEGRITENEKCAAALAASPDYS